jgi:preprotein translocase subunit SecY
MGWLADLTAGISPGQPLYVLLYGLTIVFFTFFLPKIDCKPITMCLCVGIFIPAILAIYISFI